MKLSQKTSLAVLLLLSLTACSSGGKSGTKTNNPPPNEVEIQLDSDPNQLQQALDNARKAKNDADQALSKLSQQKSDVDQKLAQLQDALNAAEKSNSTQNDAKALEQLKKDLSTTQDLKKNLEQKIQEATQNQVANQNKVNKLNTDLAKLTSQLNSKNNSLEETKKLLAEKTQALENLEKQLADKNKSSAELAKLQTEKEKLSAELNEKTQILARLEALLIQEREKEQKRFGNSYDMAYLGSSGDFKPGMNKQMFLIFDEKGFWFADEYSYLNENQSLQMKGQVATMFSNDKPVTSEFHNKFWVNEINRQKSREEDIPQNGTANYQGKAFHKDQLADFSYTVDFAKKTGQGTVSNFTNNWSNIDLKQTKLNGIEFKGEATQGNATGKYNLAFYQDNKGVTQFLAGSALIKGELEGANQAPQSLVKERYGINEAGVEFGLVSEKQK